MNEPTDNPIFPRVVSSFSFDRNEKIYWMGVVKTKPTTAVYTKPCFTQNEADVEAQKLLSEILKNRKENQNA